MIKIGICDNDENELKFIRKILALAAVNMELDFKLFFFNNGESLINFYNNNQLDILLLDIELDKSDGIEVAGSIRNLFCDQTVKIIFISSHSEYVFKSFDVSAYHYLVKPLNSEKLIELVLKLYHELTELDDKNLITIKLRSGGEKQILRKNEIVSFELIDSPKRWISVSTMKGSYDTTGRLNTYWEDLRDFDFFKVYRSIVINLNYLNRISASSVVMDNGIQYPLSRRIKKDLNDIYAKFMLKTYNRKKDLE
ncbi:response regulator transcription factor [Enterococcus sp.]|uniref:LytR/AlgR family response regulator transcription factor n=1 Tax=Enterococcus sp. TaxID=35783 RepID=UPI00290E573C|nr:response regulator transcription factor [Enterococcus sp.]MDU5337098.1 response regulator transcription factor [Enterococcus sp.]